MSNSDRMVGGLDDLCPACHRILGDHTMREWSACLGVDSVNLPYKEIPEDMAEVVAARIREQFRLADGWLIADTVTVKAVVLDGEAGGVNVRTSALLHEFSIGAPDRPPLPVATLLFVGSPEGVKRYGVLVRDSANGAANAAGRGGPQGRGTGGGKRQ